MILNALLFLSLVLFCPVFYILIALFFPPPFKDRNGSKLKQFFAKVSFKED